MILARRSAWWLENVAKGKGRSAAGLFFSGGPHRAFPEGQAGPRDVETGFVIGGRAVLLHNLVRVPLLGDNLGESCSMTAATVFADKHVTCGSTRKIRRI
jgi:hypothetical protein